MCKWLLNGVTLDCAMTLTTGHHRALNILYPRGGGYREMGVLVIYELTDADGCFPTFTHLCRWGWTLTNIFFFTQIKPGVMEVYYV